MQCMRFEASVCLFHCRRTLSAELRMIILAACLFDREAIPAFVPVCCRLLTSSVDLSRRRRHWPLSAALEVSTVRGQTATTCWVPFTASAGTWVIRLQAVSARLL